MPETPGCTRKTSGAKSDVNAINGEGRWGVEERAGYPVDGEKLRRVALGIARLAQDVGDALVGGSEALRLFEAREGLYGRKPAIEIHERCRLPRHDGVEGLGS